jgi:hypothetical protein
MMTAVMAFVAAPAGAASIGVNFSNTNAGTPPTTNWGGRPLMPTDTGGVEAQQNWNNLNTDNPRRGVLSWDGSAWVLNNPGTYVDSAGNVTTLSLSGATGGTYDTADVDETSGDGKLMSGENPAGSGATDTSSFTVSNVPYDTYDLIVYTLERKGHSGEAEITISDGTTTYYVNPVQDFSSHVLEDNTTSGGTTGEATYVRFVGLSNASDATITWGNNGNGWQAGATGFQIFEAAPAVIPEPISALAVILGGGALAGYVRRRRA